MPRRCSSGRRSVSFPGQRPNEPGLAVVDVPGRADRQRHAVSGSSARPPRRPRRRRSRRRGARARRAAACRRERCRRPAAPRAAAAPEAPPRRRTRTRAARASGSAPPPTRATVSSTSPPTREARRSARPRTVATGSSSMRSTGISRRARSGSRARASVPSSAASVELVRAERALQRMPAEPLDEVGPPDHDPGLRPAEQLVPGEADEVGSGSEARRRGRLVAEVGESAGAEVVDERQPVPPGELRQRREVRQLGEADNAEVRLVHAQDRRGVRARSPARSRSRACGSSCRPRRDARPSARARRGCGSRRRSPRARPATRSPRDPRRAPPGRAAPPRRCC